MSQQDIYQLMKKKPNKWWLPRELAEEIGVTSGAITTCLAKMFKYREVSRKLVEKTDNYWGVNKRYYWKIK